MMNKKGNIFSAAIFALVIFMVGFIVLNFIKGEVSTAYTAASCSAPATDGTKLLCLVIDGVVPYFIWLTLSIAGGMILDKTLL